MDSLPTDDKLLIAFESGDFHTALSLLPKDGPLIAIGPEGFTPLHYACRHGEANVTRLLVSEYRYSNKSTNIYGQTPAHVAAKYGHVEALVESICVRGLSGSDADTSNISSLVDNEGNTPLHTASAHGQLQLVKHLVSKLHCNPVCTNLQTETPLHLAAGNGHLDVIKYLIEKEGCPTSPVDEYGGTPLYTAARHGQVGVVQYLAKEKKCDPSVCTTKRWKVEWAEMRLNFAPGRTPLHIASQEGHLSMVCYLTNELKCDPSCRDNDGITPLYLASQQGHLDIVKFLVLECKSDPNVSEHNGCTPLHSACWRGNIDVVRFLVGNGGDHEVKDHIGQTPIHLASMSGQLALIRFLTGKGSNFLARNTKGNTAVSLAAGRGRLDVLEFFIAEMGCHPMIRGRLNRTLVHIASEKGQLEIVKYLINEYKLDPNCQDEKGETPLHQASTKGHLEVVRFLTEKGCDPLARNSNGNTSVRNAALNERLDVLKFFITEKECDPMIRDQSNKTLIHCTSEKGCLEVVQYLIDECQVDPSCKDEKGKTPLHLASTGGHLAVVRFLTEKGCDPLAKNTNGNTPVRSAALNGRMDVLKFFITEKGCDPMVRGHYDRTLVHSASEIGCLETVQYLINECQVDPSCQDENRETPLHRASKKGHLAVIRFLTEKGCDPLARNKDGNTPVRYATLTGRLDVLKFFISEKGRDLLIATDPLNSTLIHTASQEGHLETVQYLVNEHQADPSSQNKDGETPLHLAAKYGQFQVVKFLVEKAHCDPFQQPSTAFRRFTPMSLAVKHNHHDIVLYLRSKGVSMPKGFSMTKDLLEFRVSIYCIGNQSMGKSTLVKALSTEGTVKMLRKVRDVPPETAGIIPMEFNSRFYGNVTFFDFAGHKEYHASHEMFFEKNSHPVVLLTVSISEEVEAICSNIRSWKQFLLHVVAASNCQADIIIVGSHADLVVPNIHTVRSSFVLENFESTPSLRVVDSVLLDCRQPSSTGMSKLRRLLNDTCKRVRLQSEFDYRKGGILNGFIKKYLNGVAVLTFSELLSKVESSPEPDIDPIKPFEVLYKACTSLSISSHIVLLEDSEPEDSWVVLQKEVILSQVHGLLKHMKESTKLGIVPRSLIERLLQEHAQDLPPDLAIGYMKKMVGCSEIESEALAHIHDFPHELVHFNEEYFFFPSLVSVKQPIQVRECTLWQQEWSYKSGWFLTCNHPDNFFTPKFLQVLLFELTCQFALKVNKSSPVQIEPKNGCFIWKNGVHWLDPRGIAVSAEVDKDGNSLSLTLKSVEKAKLQCASLRSKLIHSILKIKSKLCGEIEVEEYFIHPLYLEQSGPSACASETNPPEHLLIPLSEIANALLQPERQIVMGRMPNEAPIVSIEDLLYFEPYQSIGVKLLLEMYNFHIEHNFIEYPVLEDLAQVLSFQWEDIATVLNTAPTTIADVKIKDHLTDTKKCLEILIAWSGRKGTWGTFRHDLDQYSVFNGRTLLHFCSEDALQKELQKMTLLEIEEQQQNLETDRDVDTGFHLELIDDSPLGIESLVEVMTELKVTESADHPTELGLALGLRHETIKDMEKENHQSGPFVEIIAAWLRKVDQASSPSWRSLAKAHVAPTVDCPQIATRITERHPSGRVCSLAVTAYSFSEAQLQKVDNSSLSTSSLNDVLKSVWKLRHIWFHLGLVLGLNYDTLKSIQTDYHPSSACIRETLYCWLCLKDQVKKRGRPCWRTLVGALTHPLVGEMSLAVQLAETFEVNVREFSNAVTSVQVNAFDPPHACPLHPPANST